MLRRSNRSHCLTEVYVELPVQATSPGQLRTVSIIFHSYLKAEFVASFTTYIISDIQSSAEVRYAMLLCSRTPFRKLANLLSYIVEYCMLCTLSGMVWCVRTETSW